MRFVMLLVLAIVPAVCGAQSSLMRQAEDALRRLREAETKIASLESDRAKLAAQVTVLTDADASLNAKLDSLTRRLEQLEKLLPQPTPADEPKAGGDADSGNPFEEAVKPDGSVAEDRPEQSELRKPWTGKPTIIIEIWPLDPKDPNYLGVCVWCNLMKQDGFEDYCRRAGWDVVWKTTTNSAPTVQVCIPGRIPDDPRFGYFGGKSRRERLDQFDLYLKGVLRWQSET